MDTLGSIFQDTFGSIFRLNQVSFKEGHRTLSDRNIYPSCHVFFNSI